ncbi:MAG: YqeG family HAD IIIA-type phosphatase [Eubacterium sp.]|nr:YqeG family HAD IIIA-type phosphatase [Eubacterium sp.]
MAVFGSLYPDLWCRSAYEIDYEAWYQKGYRAVLYDIDNTLVPHGAPADEAAVELFARLHAIGFKTCLISNNQMYRVRPFADQVHSKCIVNAHKPAASGYQAACHLIDVPADKALFVGDQLFTDICGANRAGIFSILVQPIHPREEIQIILKRRLEWILLAGFRRKLEKQGKTDIPQGHFQQPGRTQLYRKVRKKR